MRVGRAPDPDAPCKKKKKKWLMWSGIVQGFSTPPLMLLILLMTNSQI